MTRRKESFQSVFTPRPAHAAPPSDLKTFPSTGSLGTTWDHGRHTSIGPPVRLRPRESQKGAPPRPGSLPRRHGREAITSSQPCSLLYLHPPLLCQAGSLAVQMSLGPARHQEAAAGWGRVCNRTPPLRSCFQPPSSAEDPQSWDRKEQSAAFIRRGASSVKSWLLPASDGIVSGSLWYQGWHKGWLAESFQKKKKKNTSPCLKNTLGSIRKQEKGAWHHIHKIENTPRGTENKVTFMEGEHRRDQLAVWD